MESLHALLLVVHGILRWVVLAIGVVALVRLVSGARAARTFEAADAKLVKGFLAAFDTQVLVGLVLYLGVSPLGVRMFENAAAAMKTPSLRFFMVEHVFGMLLAATVLHVGTARARRLGEDAARYRATALAIALGFVVLAASIPWPFFPYARPLFRGL